MTAFEYQVQIRWGDYDALRHVNNVKYFEFMQDARVGLIEALGIPKASLATVGQFVVRNEIDYLAPIGLDVSQIVVKIWVTRIGGASYNLDYEFLGENKEIFAKAATVMVTVDMATNTVIRIPEEQRELLARFSE